MRAFVALCLVGCSSPHHEAVVDAPAEPPPDGVETSCSAAAGTANVVMHFDPVQVYDRAFAGGVLLSGPVAGVAGVPFSLKLVFAKQSPVPVCCASDDTSCCGIVDTLRAEVDELPAGDELGSHAVTVSGAGFSASGTLTISDWIQPFDAPPGHVAGSLSATIGAVTIDGTFDDTFCAEMLGVTI